ncbi:TonB-dependent receptor [Verrucomicrobiaceae bacterium 227]
MNSHLQFLIVVSPLSIFSLSAQDFLKGVELLDPVIVTASRTEEEIVNLPYQSRLISEKAFLEEGLRTLPEALANTPGISVQKTAHGHGSPYIRGFTGRQNLIMVDGVRVNDSAFRSGPVQYWNTIDPYSLSGLEVVRGPGAALYGSDAIGGTVNALTRGTGFRDEDMGTTYFHGASMYRYESNGKSNIGRLESQFGVGGKYGFSLGVSAKDYGDIRDSGVGLMPNTGYQEIDYDLKFDYALSDSLTLTLAHQKVTQDDIWRTHRTIFFEPWEGTSLSSPDLRRVYDQSRSLSYLKLKETNGGGLVDAWDFTLSYQSKEEDFDRTRNRSGLVQSELDSTEVETYGLGLQLESEVGAGRFVYGVDYYRDEVDSTRETLQRDPGTGSLVSRTMEIQGPVGDDASYDLFGAFAQYRWAAMNERLNLTLGGRYTYAKADIGRLDDGAGGATSASRSWDNAVFNARALYEVTDNWNVYAGVGQSFRAPNVSDLSSLRSSRTDVISTGSLDIEPEEYLTYELGTHFGGGPFTASAAVFYTDISDAIVSRPIGTVPGTGEIISTSTNGSDGYLFGAELEAAWEFRPQWTLRGYLAWIDGEQDVFLGSSLSSVEEPMSRLAPLKGSLALRWDHPSDRFWMEARVTAAVDADRLSSGDKDDTSRIPVVGTPGYVVGSVNAGWQVNDDLLALLSLENVTDEDYRTHGSGLNEQGFNAVMSLKYSW